MKKSFIALAFGTLGLGIAEFVIMGILPDIARALHIDIATAGHLISAYALRSLLRSSGTDFCPQISIKAHPFGIGFRNHDRQYLCFPCPQLLDPDDFPFYLGTPAWSLFRSRLHRRRKISYQREGFGSCFHHGCRYDNSEPVRSTFRNFLEYVPFLESHVPTRRSMGDRHSLLYLEMGSSGRKPTRYRLYRSIPFLKIPGPLLLIFATLLGNGGIFCWYSYINPLLTQISGFPVDSISLLMILAGAGMVAGNLISGRLSDRYTPGRVAFFTQGCAFTILLLIFFLARVSWISATLMCLCTACLFALSTPQQILLIRYSKGGEMLGAASVQIAFNLGNAIGAYCGGLPLQAGLSYQYSALAGTPFALTGFMLLLVFTRKYETIKA